MSKKRICIILAAILVVAAVAGIMIFKIRSETVASEISVEKAEVLVNNQFDDMGKTKTLAVVAEKNNIKVNDITYGNEKNIILDCTVTTVDLYSAISPEYNFFMSADAKKKNGTMFKSALDFKLEFEPRLIELAEQAQLVEFDFEITLYETDGGVVVYANDEAVDAVYGGIIRMQADVEKITTFKLGDGTEERQIESPNVNKGFNECIEAKRNAEKPDTAGALVRMWNGLKKDFKRNFIDHDRWKTILTGLGETLKLTFFALLIGIIIGFIVAFVRCTYLKAAKKGFILKFFNAICQFYLTVIRGTPVVVQIMIIYFVIFMPMGVDKFVAAVICFGLNSGAYVAEIVRGGIMSIDNGQTEAGRSLGFNYMQTMWYIIFPQAFKNVLPALANEFVVLLKETSIAFYIGLGDLMYAGNAIRAATYSPFMPLVAVALIYLVMVLVLSKLVSILERRLRNSER